MFEVLLEDVLLFYMPDTLGVRLQPHALVTVSFVVSPLRRAGDLLRVHGLGPPADVTLTQTVDGIGLATEASASCSAFRGHRRARCRRPSCPLSSCLGTQGRLEVFALFGCWFSQSGLRAMTLLGTLSGLR